jgi:hypothetical protein
MSHGSRHYDFDYSQAIVVKGIVFPKATKKKESK